MSRRDCGNAVTNLSAVSVTLVLVALTVFADGGTRTFTSPDGSFRFKYPASYRLYSGANIEGEVQQEQSFIPLCNTFTVFSRSTLLACVVYPRTEYRSTNFEGAALQVDEVAADNASQCLVPMSGDNLGFEIPKQNAERVIDGVRFVHGLHSGAATSHWIWTDLYRAFYKGKCYELAINITYTAFGVSAAGTARKFTPQDKQHVRRSLQRVVDSFRFLH